MMHEQTLVKTIEPVKRTTISRLNKGKKWKYGYDKENDIIVISKTGQIGEIIEIQNLRIALPKMPVQVFKHKKNKWVKTDQPKKLERLKNIFVDFGSAIFKFWISYISPICPDLDITITSCSLLYPYFHFLPLLSLLIVVFFIGSITLYNVCSYIT